MSDKLLNRIKCFFGFHKWLYQRWTVDRGGDTASLRLYVKECKRPRCRKIIKVSTIEGIRMIKRFNTQSKALPQQPIK